MKRKPVSQIIVYDKPVPGDLIILIGYAGQKGTLSLIESYKERLCREFPMPWIAQAEEWLRERNDPKMWEMLRELKVKCLAAVGEYGILDCLWEMVSKLPVGVTVDLEKIPVLPETVAITEFLEENPYRLDGSGAYLLITQDMQAAEDLREKGMIATSIGKITEKKGKTVCYAGVGQSLAPTRKERI